MTNIENTEDAQPTTVIDPNDVRFALANYVKAHAHKQQADRESFGKVCNQVLLDLLAHDHRRFICTMIMLSVRESYGANPAHPLYRILKKHRGDVVAAGASLHMRVADFTPPTMSPCAA